MLKVSRSGYYEWRGRALAERDWADAYLANTIRDIHTGSRGCYGAPRVHDELRLGRGIGVGCKRVGRLMKVVGVAGICHKAKGRNKPAPAVHDDLVKRKFVSIGPNRLWCADITEHPTAEGEVYCAAVLDCYSRMIVGWSIADHMRTELVVDALGMAAWRRHPQAGTVVHSDYAEVHVKPRSRGLACA